MSLLLRLATVLCLICLPSMAVAVLVGRAQPPPILIGQLHLADCHLPCWIGITPGETRTKDTSDYLHDTFLIAPTVLSRLSDQGTYDWFTLLPLSPNSPAMTMMPAEFVVINGIINEVHFPALFGPDTVEMHHMPLLGDLVNLMGEPTCVNPSSSQFRGWSVMYEYPAQVVEIVVSGGDRVSWAQPVAFISIRRSDLAYPLTGCRYNESILPTWSGLMRRQHYTAALLKLREAGS